VAVGVNLYFNIDYLKSAIDVAKCCIAKKQAAQVSREANFMGRCADIENEISFLQSSLILLENYTYLGDYNQITESEALELIERVHNLCNCGEQEIYDTPEVCELDEICILGSVQEGESVPSNIPQQTTYPDLQCNYVFSIVDPTEGALSYVLSKNDSNVWELIDSNFDVLDTNSSVTGAYTFSVGDNSYTINVSTGTCPSVTCDIICVGGSYAEDGGDSVNIPNQTLNPSVINGSCYYTFSVPNPRGGVINLVLTKIGLLWTIYDSSGVLDTNSILNGTYNFYKGAPINTSYVLTIRIGACE
jgi:hypothetical protein